VGAAEHYRLQRETLSELFAGLGTDQLATAVPGCPQWTVRDALAHLVGVPVDVMAGTVEGSGSPPWTQAQVDAREGRSVGELLDEWEGIAPAFEGALDDLGVLGWILVMDVTMHGDDVHEALGQPLGDSETHDLVLERLIGQARKRAPEQGSLTLWAGGRSWTLGEGGPEASLRVMDTGELGRVVGGRRSDDAVRALDWTGDPEPWIPVLPLFREGRA
jgi:uncharacterized protein (TIGR03083 family)